MCFTRVEWSVENSAVSRGFVSEQHCVFSYRVACLQHADGCSDQDRYKWKTPYLTSAGGIVGMSFLAASSCTFDVASPSLRCIRIAADRALAASSPVV